MVVAIPLYGWYPGLLFNCNQPWLVDVGLPVSWRVVSLTECIPCQALCYIARSALPPHVAESSRTAGLSYSDGGGTMLSNYLVDKVINCMELTRGQTVAG